MAGYDPQNGLAQVATQKFTALRAAGANCLSFVTYRVEGGAELSVQVTYAVSGTALQRSGADWNAGTNSFSGGSTQPLANAVNLLTFTYYDMVDRILQPSVAAAGGCPSGSAPTIPLLDGLQASQVRRIGITLRMLDSRPRIPPESYTVTSHVYLRNR